VERAAQHAAMPVRSFVRHFVAEAGTPPLRWLLRQRILAAQQLLELGDASVDRVARACGFGSAVSLRLHFRRALGTSPLAYRRTFRKRGEQRPSRPSRGRGEDARSRRNVRER
jgi:transcriptional regulator GlxA family with amidase domain